MPDNANSTENVLYIVAPAYNESENIKNFVDEWYPVVERHNGGGLSRLVVVDDGSKDDTYKILQDMAETRGLLLPLTKPNGGHGSALISATSMRFHTERITSSRPTRTGRLQRMNLKHSGMRSGIMTQFSAIVL